jgi:hypothetical protein
MTPDEHIHVHVCVGTRNDSEDMVFKSAKKIMELGMRYRGGTVSREGFRMNIFD